MNTDFNAAPYFDDFDAQKGYHKILFKPGTSVQARELNQLQTTLQEQINRFGSHVFKNGSMVIPGATKFDRTGYVCLNDLDSNPDVIALLEGSTLTQDFEGSTLEAFVYKAEYVAGVLIAAVSYSKSAIVFEDGQPVNIKEFKTGVPIVSVGNALTIQVATTGPTINAVEHPYFGKCLTAIVHEGVYFVDGYFVHTPTQRIVADWFNQAPSVRIGFHIVKDIVSAYDDVTLFDNAVGAPNEGAPGADRVSIELQFTTRPLGDDVDDFIELLRFVDGFLRVNKQYTDYNVIGDTLARRTYDESGDYSITGFNINVHDHRKDELTPMGLRALADGGDDNLLAIEVGPGKAYVKGYEVENYSNMYLEVDKARTQDGVKFANDVLQVNQNGHYIYLAPGNRFIDISKHPIIWLTNGVESTSTVIGYCIPKHMDAVSISGQTIFKLYGSFFLTQGVTYGWGHIGGWRLDDIHNGPVLQVARLIETISNFNVADGLQLTSHVGFTPYAWDGGNRHLYLKKTQNAPVFNTTIQVVKGVSSGYVDSMVFNVESPDGQGDIFKLDLTNIKTIKDVVGNIEIQADMGFTCSITTNGSGYGVYNYVGDGVFTGNPVAANRLIDNAYFNNIVNIENDGKRLVINNVAHPNSVFSVSATLRKNLTTRSKTLIEGQTTIAAPSARLMAMAHKDIYRIKAIHVSADLSTTPTTLDPDISKFYKVSSGATRDFYNNDFIRANAGVAVPNGQMLVVYDYFLHGTGDLFSVDSYESLKDEPTDANDLTHIGRIPSHVERDVVFKLADCFDFRKSPRDGFFILRGQATNGSPNITLTEDYRNVIVPGSTIFCDGFIVDTLVNSIDSLKIVASNNSTKTGVVHVVINVPGTTQVTEPFVNALNIWALETGGAVQYDATFFLERWDRVIIDKNGAISYKYGVPGIQRFPEVPVDSMSLATIRMQPFTATAKSVFYTKDDNRRYTMRDIGKLERRIENLEYYSTLSLKELDTKNMKIIDAATGLDRFKSGLFVTDFRDFNVFNPFSTGFEATLYPEANKLIPKEYSISVDLVFNSVESTGYRVTGNNVYLPYTDSVEIEQPYATFKESVNPYLIIDWNPATTLNPSVDNWVETEWAPTLTNIANISNTVINDIQVINNTTNTVDANRTVSVFAGWGVPDRRETTTTQTVRQTGSNVVTTEAGRATVTNVNTSTRLIGESIIPLMRSRTVRFIVNGMKPETRYWPAFDSVDVSEFCRPVNVSTMVTGTYGAALVSNPMGDLIGDFEIPHNRFSTGEKSFSLADINVVQFPEAGTECVASAIYTANGILRTMQQVIDILNTETITLNRVTTVNQTTTVNRVNTTFVDITPAWNNWGDGGGDGGGGADPLAQSFDTFNIPASGMFVTKIDLYFAHKDPSLPVFVELRNMKNGYPATGRLPGSLVGLAPHQVNVSSDSTVATSFVFNEPIFLQGDMEYAFVVFANTSRYWAWCSKLGEKVVNMDRIVGEQPHLGSLFKSQNASTWTPYQLEDLKFRIHRANFNTDATMNAVFENTGMVDERRVLVSDLYTTSGSKLVRVRHPNHGMQVNELVAIRPEYTVNASTSSPSGATAFNNIPMSQVYGIHAVKQTPDINHYVIEVANTANATGFVEDFGRFLWSHANTQYYRFKHISDAFAPAGTRVDYFANLKSGKDFDGSQSYNVPISEMGFAVGDINNLPHVGSILTEHNEVGKSVTVRAVGKSNNSYISPVMTRNGSSFTAASLALNSPSVTNETVPNSEEGNVASKAETQIIKLKTPANALRVYTTESKQEYDGIEIYYRTTLNRDLEERSWIKFEPEAIAIVLDTEDYVEHERKIDEIADFNEFQLKIVFKGTDSCKYPSIKELRAIAVAR